MLLILAAQPTSWPSRDTGGVQQRIARTRLSDGTPIAYATVGHGPFLVHVPGWLTHLELGWALPPERAFYESLAQGRTLLRYDKPGCGLSGRPGRPYSMALELETLDAVTRAAGAQRFDLFGVSLGALVAASWTAARPERVRRLALYGGWVHGPQIAGQDVQRHVLGLIAKHWGLGTDVLTDIFAPDADAPVRKAFRGYQREAASATTAGAMLALAYQVDISAVLARIEAPTVVIHRDRDRAAPLEQGRELAELIPGARFELLSGRSHLPYVGDGDAIAALVRRFLGLASLSRGAGRTLTPRQREVAALITDGMTNRQIAVRLGITERSAESHVERIRERLAVRSRAQIAAWFTARSRPEPDG